MRVFVIAIAVVLAGCPDKNSPERRAHMAVEKMTQYASMMCACKDKACADKVQEDLTNWATEMARDAGKTPDRPDEATMKKMSDVAQRYGECMTKAMSYPGWPPRDDVPPAGNAHDADSLLREARRWAREKQPDHFANDVRIAYVDANGEIDREYGELTIAFGRSVRKADDPKRKIGAPVPPREERDDCFQLTWKREPGWSRTTYGCSEAYDVATRCTVKQMWQRAIDRKAPAEGLASLSMRTTSAGGSWEFRIEDEPRNVHIVESFADDCPLAVEK